MAGEQQFKVFLSFKDEATGKFIKATEDQINSMKKLGLTVKKEGASVAVDMDKMGQGMDETGRHSRYLGTEISALAGKIGTIRNMILVWMFALRPLINTIKESVEAAKQQEDAERRLATVFAATGAGSRAGTNAIIEQAHALQLLTGTSDDEIIAAAGILAGFKLNEQQISRLLPLMVDMSKVVRSRTGEEMSLAAVSKAVGTAFSTNASRLQYLGINIDAATKKTKDFDTILQTIKGTVGGAAESMAKTFSGQMNIWNAAMKDFHESIGNVITRSPYFISLLQMMTKEIEGQNKALKDSQEKTANFATAWKYLLSVLVVVWTMLKTVWNILIQIGRVIDTIIIGIVEFAAKVLVAVDAIILALLSIIPGTKGIQKALLDAGNSLDTFRVQLQETNKSMVSDLQAGDKALGNTLDDALNLYGRLLEGADQVSAQMKVDIKGLVGNLDDLENKAGQTFNATQTFMQAAATGMRDAMVDGFFKLIKGDFEGLGDVVASFGDMMLKTILQIVINMAMIKIGLGSFLGFAGGAVAHSGGYVMSPEDSFGYRKKFHSGGEVPATLLEGEGVVNRTGMRNLGVDNLNKLNRGEQSGGGGVVNNYIIQTIDERSFRERLQQHGDLFANASEGAIRDNSSLRRTTQRWG